MADLAAILKQLQDVVDAFATPPLADASLAQAAAVARRAEALFDASARLADREKKEAPSQSDRAELVRCFSLVGERLAAFEGALKASGGGSPGQQGYVGAACALAAACSALAYQCQLRREELARFARCLPFVCACGGAATERASAALAPGGSFESAAAHTQTLTGLLSLLHAQVLALRDVCVHVLRCPDVLEGSLPPALMHSWVLHAAVSLATLEPHFGGPGSPHASVRGALAEVLSLLLAAEGFDVYDRVLRQDGGLMARCVQLLLPAASAAAVALQLPAERRPRECRDWTAVVQLSVALRSALRAGGGLEPLLLSAGCSSSAIGTAAARLLRAASQLVAHAPAASTALGERPDDLVWLSLLLGAAANAQVQRLRRQADSGGAAAAAAAAVLPAIPAMAALLRTPIGHHRADLMFALHDCLVLMTDALDAFDAAPLICGSREALARWCSTVACALQAVPAAVQLAQQAGARGDASDQDALQRCPNGIAAAAWWLAEYIDSAVVDSESLQQWTAAADGAEAALRALWQLHTACCRLFWLSRAGDMAGWLPLLSDGELMDGTVGALARPLANASVLLKGVRPAESGGVPHEWAAATRIAQAMALALAEVVAALPNGAEPATAPWPSDLQAGAVSALACAPAAFSALPAAEALCGRVLALVAKLSPAPQASMLQSTLALAVRWPHLRPLVVAAGALDRLAALPKRFQASALDWALNMLERLSEVAEAAVHDFSAGDASPQEQQLMAEIQQQLPVLDAALGRVQGNTSRAARLAALLPPARRLAEALLAWWRRPEAEAERRLALARAAAARSCAYLRCANLRRGGGPAAGQSEGSSKCGGCRVAWYCNEACSHANWRGPSGHRKACKALGEERQAERERARQVDGQPQQRQGSG